jgi:hypothetical protein
VKVRFEVLRVRLAAGLRRTVSDKGRLRRAALLLVLLPPFLLGAEALARARLSPVTERPAATRVYGRPLVLDRGARPDAALVEEHLKRVGYRPARGREVGIGEYYLGSWGWIIGRRPFRGMEPPGVDDPSEPGEGDNRAPGPPGNLPGAPVEVAASPSRDPGDGWSGDLAEGGFLVAELDYAGRITRMEDENGRRLSRAFLEPELIGRISGGSDEDRLPVGLAEVPGDLIAALLTVEDQRFFQHHGLDFRRIVAAAAANLRVGRGGARSPNNWPRTSS